MNETTEFSFVLKPSSNGVGVYAAHDIDKGTLLRLLGEKHEDFIERKTVEVPEMFRSYCLGYDEGLLICPRDFGQMSLEWYVNHAPENEATATTEDGIHHYAARNISTGEEITIDYNLFKESPRFKSDYYLKT